MILIYPNEKQVNDLIDEVWRDDYEKPFIGSVFGLRKLRLMLTLAIEQTEHYPSKNFSNAFINIQNEVERLLGIIDDRALSNSDDNEKNEDSESLSEMADNLEGWFEELDEIYGIDDPELSTSQLEEIEFICETLIEYEWRVIGVLKGYDDFQELGVKWIPNLIPASINPEFCIAIYDRAVQVALADWVGPNERCLAITIALAITVSPDLVFVNTDILATGIRAFSVQYRGIKAYFSNHKKESESFSGLPILFEQDGARMVEKITLLKDLAKTYDDHNNDVKARKFLCDFLPSASSPTDKAAVLALAWAILQRQKVESTYPGFVIDSRVDAKPITYVKEYKSKDLDVYIGVTQNTIVSSHFPGFFS